MINNRLQNFHTIVDNNLHPIETFTSSLGRKLLMKNVWFSLLKVNIDIKDLFNFSCYNSKEQILKIGLFWTIVFQIHKSYYHHLYNNKKVSIRILTKRIKFKAKE